MKTLWNSFFSGMRRSARRRNAVNGISAVMEKLETRTVPALSISGGIATFTGTNASETMTIDVVSATGGNRITFTLGTTVTSVPQRDVREIIVRGLSGNDLINAANALVKLRLADGGAGNDTITGSAKPDTIIGGAGNDVLSGGGGSDSITGGDGNDTITGGDGDDRMLGGNGNDLLQGGAGDDDLFGDAGMDKLYGGQGQDSLVSGPNTTTLRDSLFANVDDDWFTNEGSRPDVLQSDPTDTVSGGGGNGSGGSGGTVTGVTENDVTGTVTVTAASSVVISRQDDNGLVEIFVDGVSKGQRRPARLDIHLPPGIEPSIDSRLLTEITDGVFLNGARK